MITRKYEPTNYPIKRFIHDDIRMSQVAFSQRYHFPLTTMNAWGGIGHYKMNSRAIGSLPIEFLMACAKETDMTMTAVFAKLSEYYAEWERDNRYQLICDNVLDPNIVQDYIALIVERPYHCEDIADDEFNYVYGWFNNIIVEVRSNNTGKVTRVYTNDDKQTLLLESAKVLCEKSNIDIECQAHLIVNEIGLASFNQVDSSCEI